MMKVSELIKQLQGLPQNEEVNMIFDGAARKCVNMAYLSNEIGVCLASFGDVIYYDSDRPIGSPTESENKYFKLPSK